MPGRRALARGRILAGAGATTSLVSTPEEIVYAEAVRAIEHQPPALSELRSRTSILLAASGVSGGVLGKAAADHGGIGAAGVVAIVLLAGVAGLCIAVLLPRWDEWKFATSPAILLADYVDRERSDAPTLCRVLRHRSSVRDEHDQRDQFVFRRLLPDAPERPSDRARIAGVEPVRAGCFHSGPALQAGGRRFG